MFDFDQYLGFILFLLILTIGFWLLIFLTAILPYWIGGSLIERLKENKKRKEEKLQEDA
jgi:predicted membrane protein